MKFFNKWLTPEEEEKLKAPSRRVFCIGALSTLCLAAAPVGFKKVGNLYVPNEWRPCMQVNWIGPPENLHPSLYATLISDIQRHAAELTALGPEHFRHIYTRDPFYKDAEEERFLLTVETDVPEPMPTNQTFASTKHDIKAIYNHRPNLISVKP